MSAGLCAETHSCIQSFGIHILVFLDGDTNFRSYMVGVMSRYGTCVKHIAFDNVRLNLAP
jgi:hypothetical protein